MALMKIYYTRTLMISRVLIVILNQFLQFLFTKLRIVGSGQNLPYFLRKLPVKLEIIGMGFILRTHRVLASQFVPLQYDLEFSLRIPDYL